MMDETTTTLVPEINQGLSESHKNKPRVIHTPDETESILVQAVHIFLLDPDITGRQLYAQAQSQVLEPSRHTTLDKPRERYTLFLNQVKERVSRHGVGGGGDSPGPVGPEVTTGTPGDRGGAPGVGMVPEEWAGLVGRVLDLVGDQHTLETVALQLMQNEIKSLHHSVSELTRFVPRSLTSQRVLESPVPSSMEGHVLGIQRDFQTLNSTVSSLQVTIQGVMDSQEETRLSIQNLESLLTKITVDLGITDHPVGAGDAPEPESKEENPDSGSSSPETAPRLKVVLIGAHPNQVPEIRQQVNGSVQLKIIESSKRYDDQTIIGADWVIMARRIGHKDTVRIRDIIGSRQRIIEPASYGIGSIVSAIKGLADRHVPE